MSELHYRYLSALNRGNKHKGSFAASHLRDLIDADYAEPSYYPEYVRITPAGRNALREWCQKNGSLEEKVAWSDL